MSVQTIPVEMFYSYADADEPFLDALEQHLSLLQHEGLITPWYKRQILPGKDWKGTLDSHLNTASVILLLVSPDFLASDYCYSIEMQRAMQRYENNDACVIPILLRTVDWHSAPFSKLKALPHNGKPITCWTNYDEAFFDVAQGIRAVLEDICYQMVKPQIKNVVSLPLVESKDMRAQKSNGGLKTLKERFEGPAGRRLLVDALATQKIVAGNLTLAEELASLVQVIAARTGKAIIHQGASDNDIFFILAGSFNIIINGKVIAKRGMNDHIGEMSAIEPSQVRTATVVADENSVICKLSESQLVNLGQHYGDIWRYFSKELVRRLAQRNALVISPQDNMRVFILASGESLSIAREIQSYFEQDNFLVKIWINEVFSTSSYQIESLKKAVDDSDFAIVIARSDDLIETEGQAKPAPRDSLIFALGVFIGCLGRERTLLLEPRCEKGKMPTDLFGLTMISYQRGDPEALSSLPGPAHYQIRKIISNLGPRN